MCSCQVIREAFSEKVSLTANWIWGSLKRREEAKVSGHCKGGDWNEGGNFGGTTGGEDGAPTALGNWFYYTLGCFGGMGVARTLFPPTRHSITLGKTRAVLAWSP